MTFDYEGQAQNNVEKEYEGEDDESEEEVNEEEDEGRKEEDDDKGDQREREGQVRAKGGKTSTPKPSKNTSIPALEYISHSKETITVLQSLTEQMCRINRGMEEMESKLREAAKMATPPRGNRTVPIYRAKSLEQNIAVISPPRDSRNCVSFRRDHARKPARGSKASENHTRA